MLLGRAGIALGVEHFEGGDEFGAGVARLQVPETPHYQSNPPAPSSQLAKTGLLVKWPCTLIAMEPGAQYLKGARDRHLSVG